MIGGVCYVDGSVNPVNRKQKCDPTSSTTSWSKLIGQFL